MKNNPLHTFGVVAGITLVLPGIAVSEVPYNKGLYSFHTDELGACPGLDWHVTLGPDGKLTGMVSWDGMKRLAKLQGNIQPDGHLTMNAQEVGGSGTATVVGSATGNFLTLTINGTGGPCDGKTVQVGRNTPGYGG